MGTASDMNVEPVGALTIGFLAGVLSTVGYAYIKVSYFLLSIAENSWNLKDFQFL